MAEDESCQVLLHIYDLSSGLAAQLSKSLLGKQVNGVWHTGIVYNGLEYYFGAGIQTALAGHTPFGTPLEVLSLGSSLIPADLFQEYIADLNEVWTPESYSLFDNNCNHFSEEVAQFLTGRGIPGHILSLPEEILSTPFGKMLAPSLAGVQGRLNSPPRAPRETPFGEPDTPDLIPAVTDSLKMATATVVADTGMLLGRDSVEALHIDTKEDDMQQLHDASKTLGGANLEIVSSLGRAAISRENASLRGGTAGPGAGFPAPFTRRLTASGSGEIIARLGSGQFVQPRLSLNGEQKLPTVLETSSRRQSNTNTAIDGPKEPKDGTRAEPGPPSARNVGLNAKVAYDLQRTNSGLSCLAKQELEIKVRQELASIMAKGRASPNEAVTQAIQRASAVSPSMA